MYNNRFERDFCYAAATQKPLKRSVVQKRKNMKIKIVICAFVILISSTCNADEIVTIRSGFCTGLDYIEMDQNQKEAYIIGAINGMLVSPVFGASKEKLDWLETYISGMTSTQGAGILTKFLNDNPGRWHEGLNMLTYSAIKRAHSESKK